MTIGIILSHNDPETAWNAFRFGNVALGKKHTVSIFLIGKGVECEDIEDPHFNVKEQAKKFTGSGGRIYACQTCLKSRGKEGSAICPVSTMQDLMKIVEESDKVVSF